MASDILETVLKELESVFGGEKMLIERIEKEREAAGIRPEFLAHTIGVTGATYYKWRKGTRIPADKLAEIARVLDCSADYLLGLTDQKKITA